MATTLEYILSLNDKMSSKLQKIGISSEGALNKFSKLQQQANKTSQLMKDMGGSVGALREKLSLLKNERDWIPQSEIKTIRTYNSEIKRLEKEINKFETINGSRTKRWFKDAFSQIPFSGLLTNPLVLAGAGAGKAIKLGIEDEMQKTSFEVLLGGKEASQQLVSDIKKYADKTPYEKLGLGDVAKTMLGFGIAQDKVMPNLRMLGDVAMGDANKLSSLTLAFSQISSAGRLQGQDLLQLINGGFNPLQEISKNTGISMKNLKKEMEKGNISFRMVEDAFKSATSEGGKFNGMADKMSQTVGGKWSTAIDSINTLFLKLYNIISPILLPAINGIITLVDGVINTFTWLYAKLKQGNPILIGLAFVLGTVASAMLLVKIGMIASATWAGIVAMWNGVQTASWWALNAAMLANPITWIIAGIIALIAIIAYLVSRIDGWGKMWNFTLKAMGSYWDTIVGGLYLGWLFFQNGILKGIDLIKVGWYKLKGLWDEDGSKKAIAQINNQAKKRQEAIENKKEEVITSAKNVVKYGIMAGTSLKLNNDSFANTKNKLKNVFGFGDNKIADAKIPGTNGSKSSKGNKSEALKTNEAIATGGTKNTVVHINFKNMVETFSLQPNNLTESRDEIERFFTDCLFRVLATANSAS